MIWQLSKGVSSDIQPLRSGLKKRGASEFFEPTSEYLDICDETLFLVFDVATFFSFSVLWCILWTKLPRKKFVDKWIDCNINFADNNLPASKSN